MALQTIKGGLWIPPPLWYSAQAPTFNTVTLDASGDKAATIFRIPRAGTIDQVAVGIGAITTSNELDIRLETVAVTANATPTGTLWATNTAVTTLTPTANTMLSGSLTAGAVVVRGDTIAFVVQPADADAINLNLNRLNAPDVPAGNLPYGSYNLTGAYANSTALLCCAVRYSTGEWVYLSDAILPVQSLQASVFHTGTSATTGVARGMRFRMPFPARVTGVTVKLEAGSSADFTVNLYDDAGTLINSLATLDASRQRAGGSPNHLWNIYLEGGYVFPANTFYRVVISADTANAITLYEAVINAAAHMDAFSGGQDFHLTKLVSGSWVNVATERPWMFLQFDQFDDGVKRIFLT